MLRVVVYINETPVVDTHAIREWPEYAYEGTMCGYRTDDGGKVRERFERGNGAVKLAIKLLKRKLGKPTKN